MNGRDKRLRRAHEQRIAEAAAAICLNCGGTGRHFVPPSLGEAGCYACASINSRPAGHSTPTVDRAHPASPAGNTDRPGTGTDPAGRDSNPGRGVDR